ncbi:hypothetical protein [Roseisolibacter sp. H3M3-2]|uniref:hypothetical protein n=1 Tax=Roseisolibacter sp. H3M3-2 TaxID=3031323 RepID=UPI0023DB7C59|nr:hypothetical protein [Roseisolibacter sp. H3M3-2]MDF1506283.1 hypothetical protein [Roseisolibacter sp. H3M3-2]
MSDDVAVVGREELWARLQSPTPPALFEVLPTGYWRKHHLPGAIAAPPETAVDVVRAHVPDPHAEVVLYCWDPG